MTALSETKKYQAYPEYKDSEVDWVGDIPLDWQVTRLKYVASIFGRIGFRGYTVNDIVGEGEGAVVLSPSNIIGDKFTLAKTSFLSWQKYYESPEIIVEKNDVLLVKTGSTYGKSTIVKDVDSPMTINPQMALIKNTTIDSRFLAYLFNSSLIKAKIDVNNTGSGMPTMTQENINNFPIPRPNRGLDTQISNFLDHETAKIDTLIEKQQQLIKLLKEKRQAVISHAVTKGLNPQAPMKDSGVEWLGEVPEHWKLTLFKYLVSQMGGGTPDKGNTSFWNGDIPWVSPKDMKVDYISTSQDLITDIAVKNSSTKLVPEQSILMVVRGMILIHSVPVALTTKPVTINQDMKALIPNKDIQPEFLLFFLKGIKDYILDFVETSAHGTKCLRTEDFENMQLFIPPIDEQVAILSSIKTSLDKLDSLIQIAEQAITLMSERRTALISAAVTGKIDVREWRAH
ncbi:restriction endonuclease subunit S [Vibrio furnissii]